MGYIDTRKKLNGLYIQQHSHELTLRLERLEVTDPLYLQDEINDVLGSINRYKS